MDKKTLDTLEYGKILDRLAEYTAFSASRDLILETYPTADIEVARRWLGETTEGRRLLDSRPGMTIGGARDVRAQADAAAHGVMLDPPVILDVKATLISGRELARSFESLKNTYPFLAEIVTRIPLPEGLIDRITKTLSERGEIHDNATPRLGEIRRDLRIVHDRLLTRMQKMLNDPKISPYLQDNLVTMRDGRYVLPLRTDFKGKVKAVVHDQSSSGATLFIEPLAVVDQNNEYRQLQLDERDEVRRILVSLSAEIGDHAEQISWMVAGIADLDVVFARAKYAEDLSAVEPRLKRFSTPKGKTLHPGSTIRLLGARHPLLDSATVVPIDVTFDQKTYAIIITGPNTGGKTVSLKTVGLLVLMAQSGVHIPVEPGSEITAFESIYADIGDEQSIEQSLSTFSGHITNIIRILREADPFSLLLFDELGSGTDPQEGAALGMAILTHLLDRGITTLVATHYPEMKTYALSREGVANASVEFDVETLRPTYHLVIGLPGSSNALTIASRLGLPEEIIESARSGISSEELQAGDLLAEIHMQREIIRQTRLDIEVYRNEVTQLRDELSVRLESIEDERREILEKARQEAEDRLAEIDSQIHELRRKLARAGQPLEVIKTVEEEIFELEEEIAVPVVREQRVAEPGEANFEPIRLGDKVRLKSLGSQGIVSVLSQEEAEVQIGVMRVRTRLSEIERVLQNPSIEGAEKETIPGIRTQIETAGFDLPSRPGIELDLRGMRVDDALDRLNDYVDAAAVAQMPFVRIIHGKGTGRLRDAVRKALKGNSQVQSFEGGKHGEGGEGVTVVKFVQ